MELFWLTFWMSDVPRETRKVVETHEVRLRPTTRKEDTPWMMMSLLPLLATEETPRTEQARPVRLETVSRSGQIKK